MYSVPKGVWVKRSCEKPQYLNQCIFRKVPPNIQDGTRKEFNGFKRHHTPSKRRPQAKPFEGLHSSVTEECGQRYVPWLTCVIGSFGHSELLNNGGPSSGQSRPTLGPHGIILSVSAFEIWERYRPVVFTDERTLLNGAVAHQSVNMALASQIVPLVDSGFGPKLYLAQRTQASLGGGWDPTGDS